MVTPHGASQPRARRSLRRIAITDARGRACMPVVRGYGRRWTLLHPRRAGGRAKEIEIESALPKPLLVVTLQRILNSSCVGDRFRSDAAVMAWRPCWPASICSLIECLSRSTCKIEIVISRARRVKTVNLDAVFAKAAYKRPSATLVINCQLGSLTTGSPAGHLNHSQLIEG